MLLKAMEAEVAAYIETHQPRGRLGAHGPRVCASSMPRLWRGLPPWTAYLVVTGVN